MYTAIYNRINSNRAIIVNATSLVGTTGINSAFGFLYWWIAARAFTPQAVGLASAAISAMLLLATIGMLGLGTLLITELPRHPSQAAPMIGTSLSVVGTLSLVLGAVFALISPMFSAELGPLSQGIHRTALFALGVSLTAVTLVLDQALIGLLRGKLQLARNIVFSFCKLAVLAITSILIAASSRSGMVVYFTWLTGNVISLGILIIYLIRQHTSVKWHFERDLIRKLSASALTHHALNLALQAPGLALPIIVTIILSAATNASFYASWMIATFVFVIPNALATTLNAVSAAEPGILAQKMRLTLKLSLFGGAVLSVGVFLGSGFILGLFGKNYAEQATWTLRLLALTVFPLTAKVHYVAICRVQDRIGEALRLMTAAALLELVFAIIGAKLGGLTGLSLGWSLANWLQLTIVLPPLYQVLHKEERLHSVETYAVDS